MRFYSGTFYRKFCHALKVIPQAYYTKHQFLSNNSTSEKSYKLVNFLKRTTEKFEFLLCQKKSANFEFSPFGNGIF